jgi:hypothetical protein
MAIVRFAHVAKLVEVVIKRIALASGQVIVVHHMLDAANRIVEFALIESSSIPLSSEVAKLSLGMIETLPVSMRDMPSSVSTIQIGVHTIDDGGNGTGVIDPSWAVLRLRKTSQNQKRGDSSQQMLSHGHFLLAHNDGPAASAGFRLNLDLILAHGHAVCAGTRGFLMT